VARAAGAAREEGLASAYLAIGLTEAGADAAEIGAVIDAGQEAIRAMPAHAQRPGIYLNLSAAALYAGDCDRAVEIATEGLRDARLTGHQTAYGAGIATNGADALLWRGRPVEAAALLDAHQPVEATVTTALIWYVIRAQVAVALDDLAGAARLIEAAQAMGGTEQAETTIVRHLAIARSLLALATDRAAEVPAIVSAAVGAAPAFAGSEEDDARLAWLAARALADVGAGRRARDDRVALAADVGVADAVLAAAEARLDHPFAETGAPRRRARALVELARAEHARMRGVDDAATWAGLRRTWDALGHVPNRVYATYRQAEAELATGRPGRTAGRATLATAYRDALAMATPGLVRAIEQVARRARIPLHPVTDEEPSTPAQTDTAAGRRARPGSAEALGLTPREAEILGLVAAGMSNREIGEHLYISPKTAGVHISSILGKLQVGGRVQAAAVARRLGLADPSSGDPTPLAAKK
jgi:DNA-binding CsgD family transcriptional regulator